MICAFVVMKCEGFGYITDLADYLENNIVSLLTTAASTSQKSFPLTGHMIAFAETESQHS